MSNTRVRPERQWWIVAALAVLSACFAPFAGAVEIRYALRPLHDDVFRYDYQIRNDGSVGAGAAIGALDILFDPALFDEASLTIASVPASSDWSAMFLDSAPGVPAAFDLSASGTGLEPGATLAGFAVEFRWLGAGSPAAQGYEVYDPVSFDLLQTGTTAPTSVPEPLAATLLLVGCVALARAHRRRLVC